MRPLTDAGSHLEVKTRGRELIVVRAPNPKGWGPLVMWKPKRKLTILRGPFPISESYVHVSWDQPHPLMYTLRLTSKP